MYNLTRPRFEPRTSRSIDGGITVGLTGILQFKVQLKIRNNVIIKQYKSIFTPVEKRYFQGILYLKCWYFDSNFKPVKLHELP